MKARRSQPAPRAPAGAVRTGRAAFRAVVRGRVQGVYFRRFVATRAAELSLRGYARNLADGTVEVVAEGNTRQLGRLLDLLHAGPPAAHVAGVSVAWSDDTGAYGRFSTR